MDFTRYFQDISPVFFNSLRLMALGMGGTFLALILFALLIELMKKIFPKE